MAGSMLYTKQGILTYATAQRVDVTGAQFDDWKRRGHLPESVPEPTVTRGRPRLLYPEAARDAVLWLGKHRKYIDGDDTAAFWLWLSGCDYIQIDPIMFLLTEIALAWDDLRESVPSLPDIADVAKRGLNEKQASRVLDEWDATITAPALAAEELTDQTAPLTFLNALMHGVVPPELQQRDMQPEVAALFDVPDAPHDDPRIANIALHIPYLVRAASMTTLYRRLCAAYTWAAVRDRLMGHAQDVPPAEVDYLRGQYNRLLADMITPQWLRMWWRFLTPEVVATYWRGALGKAPRLGSRDEVLRHWGYDPLQFLAFAADVSDTFQRGMKAAPQGEGVIPVS